MTMFPLCQRYGFFKLIPVLLTLNILCMIKHGFDGSGPSRSDELCHQGYYKSWRLRWISGGEKLNEDYDYFDLMLKTRDFNLFLKIWISQVPIHKWRRQVVMQKQALKKRTGSLE